MYAKDKESFCSKSYFFTTVLRLYSTCRKYDNSFIINIYDSQFNREKPSRIDCNRLIRLSWFSSILRPTVYTYLDTKRQPIAYIYDIMKQAL